MFRFARSGCRGERPGTYKESGESGFGTVNEKGEAQAFGLAPLFRLRANGSPAQAKAGLPPVFPDSGAGGNGNDGFHALSVSFLRDGA